MPLNQPKTIVLVDDNEHFAQTLAEFLITGGYDVTAVNSLRAALHHLEANPSPTFVLADRQLDDIKIDETEGLQRLIDASRGSYVVVYTNIAELREHEEASILSKGAIRVLDKRDIDHLMRKIEVLTKELDELIGLGSELKSLTAARGKMAAALLGADVGMAVVDRKYHCWYANIIEERFADGSCWTESCTQSPATTGKCWGCTVPEVLKKGHRIDRLFLSRFRDGTVRWLSARSEPIRLEHGGGVAAVREAISEGQDGVLSGLAPERRLSKIAQGLIQVGFGQARIYLAKEAGDVDIVAAAAYTDDPGTEHSAYFDSLLQGAKFFNFRDCPYALRAFERGTGRFVESWENDAGESPFAKRFGLQPPYFDVPVWGSDGRLCAWLGLDFGRIEEPRRSAVVLDLAKEQTLLWLQEDYGGEIRKTIEAKPATQLEQRLSAIVERARLGVGGAVSVDEAMRELRSAYEEILPTCRITVRTRSGETIEEDKRLSTGPRSSDAPATILLSDKDSLAARVFRELRPVWIEDYQQHRQFAASVGEGPGYGGTHTLSATHIPLVVEQTVYGSLSIDSPERIAWERSGYKRAVQVLASLTALVVRDISLDAALERLQRDRAAMTAYTATVSGDLFFRRWVLRQLFAASVDATDGIALAKKPSTTKDTLSQVLRSIRDAIDKVRSGPPSSSQEAYCSLDAVIRNLQTEFSRGKHQLVFESFDDAPPVQMPQFLVSGILHALIQNSLEAIESQTNGKKSGTVFVSFAAKGRLADIEVRDDGPGVSDDVRSLLFVDPVASPKGSGMSLLAARGAALASGGDLSFIGNEGGARFLFRVPFS